jgi:hypothetical protein
MKCGLKPFRQEMALVVDLDERGSFKAHVENQNGKTVFSFSNEDKETGWPSEDGLWLVEDGFMRHGRDTGGLLEYLKSVGIAKPAATLMLSD